MFSAGTGPVAHGRAARETRFGRFSLAAPSLLFVTDSEKTRKVSRLNPAAGTKARSGIFRVAQLKPLPPTYFDRRH